MHLVLEIVKEYQNLQVKCKAGQFEIRGSNIPFEYLPVESRAGQFETKGSNIHSEILPVEL